MKTSSSESVRLQRKLSGLSALPSILILFVLIVYPLGTLLLQTVFPHLFDFQPMWRFSLVAFARVFADPGNLTAIGNSLSLGVVAAIVATGLGTITAFGAARATKLGKSMLNLAVWIVFFSPSYVIAQGWMILMQDGGIAAQLFALPNGWSGWFFSRFGLVMVMGLRYFPFVHFAMTQAIGNVGNEMIQAGRILGANRRQRFFRIWLPLLAPAWMAGASIAFAEGFGDFGFAAAITPQMQMPLITYQIYSALNEAPVDYSVASVLSLAVVLITALALYLQFWWLNRKSYTTITSASPTVPPQGRSRGPSIVAVSAAVVAVIALVLPVGATFVASLWRHWSDGMNWSNFTVEHYIGLFALGAQGLQALLRSGLYALIASLVTSVFALLVGWQLSFKRSIISAWMNVVTIATIAVPGIVLAVSFVFAWNAVWLIPVHLVLYGTEAVLVMAYIAGSLPYAIRLQIGAMSQISPNLLKAAQVLGAREWVILRVIIFPLVRETAVTTFLITFTGTLFELPASSLLYPPGDPPFPVLIASSYNAFEWAQGAALTMVGLLVTIGSYGLGRWLVRVSQRRTGVRTAQLPVAASDHVRDVIPALTTNEVR